MFLCIFDVKLEVLYIIVHNIRHIKFEKNTANTIERRRKESKAEENRNRALDALKSERIISIFPQSNLLFIIDNRSGWTEGFAPS